MTKIIKWFFILSGVLFWISAYVVFTAEESYDCSIVEYDQSFPSEIRKECEKLKRSKIMVI